MDINERKKQLKDEYEKKKKKLEVEFKAEVTNKRKKKIKELLKVLDEVVKTDNGIDVFNPENHALLIGLLIEKIENKEKYIAAGNKIISKIKAEEERVREKNRKKRIEKKAREEKNIIETGESNDSDE